VGFCLTRLGSQSIIAISVRENVLWKLGSGRRAGTERVIVGRNWRV